MIKKIGGPFLLLGILYLFKGLFSGDASMRLVWTTAGAGFFAGGGALVAAGEIIDQLRAIFGGPSLDDLAKAKPTREKTLAERLADGD